MIWDGKERRKLNPQYTDIKERLHSIELSIGLVTEKLQNLHDSKNTSHERIYETLNKHSETLYGNSHEGLTSKVSSVSEFKKALESHIISDRWMYGFIITILLAILGKLIHG